MKTKNVQFNLYKAVVILDKKFEKRCSMVREKMRGIDESEMEQWNARRKHLFERWKRNEHELKQAEDSANSIWELQNVILAAISGKIPNITMDYRGEKIELDKNACFIQDTIPGILSFQLSRLRVNGLPAKKKLGQPREDIPLDDDEYIGEFTQVLYDSRYNVVSIQVNRYGVGVAQICRYLNYLQKEYDQLFGQETFKKYTVGDLQPIIDERLAEKAFQSECVRKIHFRCSDENIDAIISEDNQTLGSSIRLIGEQTGIVLDVSLSLQGQEPSRTLLKDDMEKAGHNFISFMNDPTVPDERKQNARMDLIVWDSERNAFEAVDLLAPKVNFIVQLQVEDRKSIASDYFYHETMEEYKKMDSRLFALLGT